jgi:enterochelin esterase-like enzyme
MDRPKLPHESAFRAIVAVVVALGIGVLLRVIAVSDMDAALVVMGFDPDRARLIDALLVAFAAVIGARLVSGGTAASCAGGLLAFALTYGGVFRAETLSALAAGGTAGRFDPAGWLLTVVTLLVVVGLVAATASVLGGQLLLFLAGAARDIRGLVTGRASKPRTFMRPAGLIGVLALVAIAGPAFADMVNFSPDVHMRQGAAPEPGLLDAGTQPYAAGTAGAKGTVDSGLTDEIHAGPGELAASATWLAQRPAGAGRLVRLQMPAPWVGGTSPTIQIAVYTPPGYDGAPGRRYPVVYAAPFGPGPMSQFLDSYFNSGTAPPEIIVWAEEAGGPYPDSECVDSADGRERMESFIVDTLVPWVDGHYRTIATADARTLFGLSQGGFCAPMLLLRHPSVFRQSISLSGYFSAGVSSGQTVNAARPFGGSTRLEASHSPDQLVMHLARPVEDEIFLVLAGSPAESFYGPQLEGFDSELTSAGIGHATIDDPLGHAWTAFERDFPNALHLVGLRQAELGVFGPIATASSPRSGHG